MAPRRFPFPTPFGWFQVAFPDDLAPGDVTPLRYWNRELVLWRDMAGDFHLQDAYCPHLGAHLAHGGTVATTSSNARSTGWRFDGAGVCTNIPYSQRTNRKAKLRKLPTDRAQRLRARVVPPQRRRAGVGIPVIERSRSGVERVLLVVVRDPHVPQEMSENGVDPAHFQYVHGTRERRGDGELRHRRTVLDDAVEAVVRHAARHDRRSHRRLQLRPRILEGLVQRHRRRDQHRDHDAHRRRDDAGPLQLHSCASFEDAKLTSTVADAFVKEINKQVQEEPAIWENKAFLPTPALADTDGPIMKFRKWYSQFYAEPYEVNA